MHRRLFFFLAVSAGLLLLPAGDLFSADLTWTGSNGTSWDYVTDNWTGGATTFTDGDHVTFDASTANRTVVPSGTMSPGRMDVTAPSYFFDTGALGGNFDFYRSDPGALAGNVLFGWTTAIDLSGMDNIDLSGAGGYTSFCQTTTLGNAAYDLTVHPGAILCFWDNTLSLVKNNIYSDGGIIYSTGYYSPSTGLSATNLFQLQGTTPTQIQQGTGVLDIQSGISGDPSGSGYSAGLIITRGGYGSGTTRLSASNSYGGDTVISNTTVELNSSAGSAVPGNLVVKGTAASSWIRVKAANQISASGVVTIQDGSAYKVIELLGQNVTIAGLDNNAAANNYGIIENTQTADQTGYGTGTLTINTPSGSPDRYFQGFIRDISLGSGNVALVKDGPGKQTIDGAYCGLFTGGLTVKAGTLALGSAGPASFSSPLIDVQGGTLDVSAKSGFTLSGTETLKGNGTVVGAVLAAAGSQIEPGESIGTLTNIGNLTLGGTLLTDYDGGNAQQTDVLAVTGDVNLENATFDFAGIGDSLSGGPYAFLTYTGTRTGEAAVVEANLPAGYHVEYDLGGKNAVLVVPEPATFALLAIGLLGGAAFARRRRRS